MRTIRYEVPFAGGVSFGMEAVLPSSKEVTEDMARDVLKLLQTSYTRQFEEPATKSMMLFSTRYRYRHPDTGKKLPTGTMKRVFDYTNPERVRSQHARIAHAVGRTATYALAYSETELVGLAKVGARKATPHEIAQGLPERYLYLNDTLAAVPNRHLGSMSLHAALSARPWSQGLPVVADGFTGSSVNAWIESLGLQQMPDWQPETLFEANGGVCMPQTRFVSSRDITQLSIQRTLEHRTPWLAEAERIA